MKRCHVFVSGKVQGVFYRAFTHKHATQLGLVGFVRNMSDGRVEVLVEGDENKINELLAKLRKGPLGAIVDDLEIKWEKARNEFDDFRILR